jgi:peptidoglycan/xylan/chitin deacetylase (PgdA/CDA1 family)
VGETPDGAGIADSTAGSVWTRRGLLAATALGTAWLAARDSAPQPRPHVALTRKTAAKPPSAPASPVVAPSPSPSPTPPVVPVQHSPVCTLADYRKVVPGPPFPATAVALTIDDGPHPTWTPKVLALLERYHVQATFCLIGNQVLGHESVAKLITKAGHHLANHTWSHPITLPTYSPDKMRQEIHRAQDKIYSTTGYQPTIFRSPGGAWSAPLYQVTSDAGMVPVDWSDDPRDWTRPGTGAIVQRMLAARPGEILLCHDGGGDRSETCAALQTVIPALLARGYTFVAL